MSHFDRKRDQERNIKWNFDKNRFNFSPLHIFSAILNNYSSYSMNSDYFNLSYQSSTFTSLTSERGKDISSEQISTTPPLQISFQTFAIPHVMFTVAHRTAEILSISTDDNKENKKEVNKNFHLAEIFREIFSYLRQQNRIKKVCSDVW